jgi:hypothetical protein
MRTSSNKIKRYVKTLVLVIFFYSIFSLTSCVSLPSKKPYQEIPYLNAADIIQSRADTKLPKRYSDLRAIQDSGLDWIIRFSFKMNRSEMDQFIKSAGFQGKLERNPIDRVVLDMGGYSWFTPSGAKKYLAGQYFSKQQNLAKKVLIDITDTEVVTVYMDVFSK